MKIVVLTGAGISQASGIPTYRDKGGIWDLYDPEVVCSIQGWRTNPELVQEFFNLARKQMVDIQPNEAHYILAELEKNHDVVIITQNIDDLHEKAGSTNIIHVHGNIFLDKHPDGNVYHNRGDMTGKIRPDVVFFGEQVQDFDLSIEKVEAADVLVVVGTSLQVYPFASLLKYYSGITYLIDPNADELSVGILSCTFNEDAITGLKNWKELMKF